MTLSHDTTSHRRPAVTDAFEVIPTGRPLAAEVKGVDLRTHDEPTFGA